MIMNSNSLPVELLQAFAASVPGLGWGQDDTVDSITGRALTYLLLSGTMGQLVSSFYSWLFQHPPRTNRFAGVMVQLLCKSVPPDDIEPTAVLDNEINLLTDGIEDIESLWRESRHGEPALGYSVSGRNENCRHPPPALQPSPYISDLSTVPQRSDTGDTPISNPDGGREHEDAPVPAWSLLAPVM